MKRKPRVAEAAPADGGLGPHKSHIAPPGTPCANCGTSLEGPYCHYCGQLAETFHRSLTHLIAETVETLLHVDGRVWRTLQRLAVEPGRLTRDYLDGKRAYQIPPMRLFLVVVLVFLFAGGMNQNLRFTGPGVTAPSSRTGPGINLKPRDTASRSRPDLKVARPIQNWLFPRVIYASTHRREFTDALESWSHQFAIMLLPVSALLLSALFVVPRRFYVYDHLIFSMHSLSFMGLLLTLKLLIAQIPIVGGVGGVLLLVMPAHLFVHMRGVYRTSVIGTLVRMFLLFLGTMVAIGLGFAALVMVGLSAMEVAPIAPVR